MSSPPSLAREPASPPNQVFSKLSNGLQQQQQQQQQQHRDDFPNNSNSLQKNLSHVPCKFFRQGQCQAGNTCPFSHSMEPVDNTPCKYYQKGNCKFGAKCALAHILPDGRRVNHRSHQHVQHVQHNQQHQHQQQQQQQHQQQQQQQQQSQQQPHEQHQASQKLVQPAVGLGRSQNEDSSKYSYTPYSPSTYGQKRNNTGNNNETFSESLPVPSMGSTDFSPSGSLTRSSYVDNLLPGFAGLKSMPSVGVATSTSITDQTESNSSQRSMSTNGPSIWNTRTTPSHSSSLRPSSMSLLMSSLAATTIDDDCAIDDEEDGLAYQEDYVPSSLTDLLTPQERERRGSRPSSSATPVTFAAPSLASQQQQLHQQLQQQQLQQQQQSQPQQLSQNSVTPGSAIPNSDIWSSSPRFSARRRDDSFTEIAGSPLRQAFSVNNSYSNSLQPPHYNHSYPAPIGTPDRSSSMSALRQFSAIGTVLGSGTSPGMHNSNGTIGVHGLAGVGTGTAGAIGAGASAHGTQGQESLFDDDINTGSALDEPADTDFETQFRMDDDELDLVHPSSITSNHTTISATNAAATTTTTSATPTPTNRDLHLVSDDVTGTRRDLYEKMGSLVR